MIWTVTHRDTWVNAKGVLFDVVHIECNEGEFEGSCIIVERESNGTEITHAEMAAEAVAQGYSLTEWDIDG